MTRFALSIYIAAVLLACAICTARAEDAWVTAKYEAVSGGYRYYLTLYNGMAPSTGNYVYSLDMYTYNLWGFDQESPPKWDWNQIYSWEVQWATYDSHDQWYDGIPPGESLSGFNVTLPGLSWTPLHPGLHIVHYKLSWSNGNGLYALFGDAYPELVPEPGGLIGLVSGLGALAIPLLRRRGRR